MTADPAPPTPPQNAAGCGGQSGLGKPGAGFNLSILAALRDLKRDVRRAESAASAIRQTTMMYPV